MNSSKRVVVNTMAQYIRSILNTVLALISTRIIIGELGVDDYGVYAVVGSVVSILGFITNALVLTTQRYISYFYGSNDFSRVRETFKNSYILHLAIGLSFAIILYLLKDIFIYDWLKIEEGRLQAAEYVYLSTILMLFFSIMAAPFKALFIARENIVYISIVEVGDGVLKLVLALTILGMNFDKLLVYAGIMLCMQLFNFCAFSIFALVRFEECSIWVRREDIKKEILLSLTNFAGWTAFNTGTIVMRNQGVAIMINQFFSAAVNAAYGISFQIYGSVAFVASSVLNAMNPQIMKAEGENNREKMMRLAMIESRFSTALLLLLIIPVMMELPQLLNLWLKDKVPEKTELFCVFILVAFIFDQLSIGLHSANMALGNLRTYSLLTTLPKLFSLVVTWFVLKNTEMLESIVWVYLGVEIIVSILRFPYTASRINFKISFYVRVVIVPLIPLALVMVLSGFLLLHLSNYEYRFLFSIPVSILCGLPILWFFTLTPMERETVKKYLDGMNRFK